MLLIGQGGYCSGGSGGLLLLLGPEYISSSDNRFRHGGSALALPR